jgi:hypothetical protein
MCIFHIEQIIDFQAFLLIFFELMNFLLPSYLFGLFLVSVPVIIHFFNFQRARKVYFTNVAFLSSVKEVTNSRNKLKNLLVLLARILFITFLVLAFARPFIPNKQAGEISNSNYVSIYFDNSYSLQNEFNEKRLFDVAVAFVEQISGIFSGNTLYQLVDNAFESNLSFFYEKDKLNEKLYETGYSNSGRTLAQVAVRQLQSVQENGANSGNHIFWVSDFQKTSVGDINSLKPDSANNYYLVPLEPNRRTNLFVDSVWLDNPFIKEQENNKLYVLVKNSGDETIENRSLKLYIDDKQVSSTTVSLEAGESKEIELAFAVNDAGEKSCKIEVEDYPVTFDNEFYFILKVAPKIRIVNINQGTYSFVPEVYSNESFYEVVNFDVNALDYNVLNSADLIVLENLDEVENALLIALQRAMNNGTSLAVFPGVNADATSFGALVDLPITSLQAVKQDGAYLQMGLKVPEGENPFFEGVFERVSSNMSMPRGAPVIEWPRSGNILLSLRNEKPFLAEVGKATGNIYLFSVPLNPELSDLPRHAIFVPVMYKIAISSKLKNNKLAYSFSENIAQLSFDSLSRNDIFKLTYQDFELIPSQRVVNNQLLINIPQNDIEAGNYRVAKNTSDTYFASIAFNYDKDESVLEYYTNDELKNTLGQYPNVQIFDAAEMDDFVKEFNTRNIAKPLWRYALLLALFFLLLEVLLIRFWRKA